MIYRRPASMNSEIFRETKQIERRKPEIFATMQDASQNKDGMAFHHVEMGLVEGGFSNAAFEDDQVCGRNANDRTPLDPVPEEVLGKDDAASCQEPLHKDGLADHTLNEDNRAPRGFWKACRGNRFQSSVHPELISDTHDKEYSQDIPIHQEVVSNKGSLGTISVSGTQRCNCYSRFIAFTLLVIFVMSATSLTLVILIINGNIVGSEDTSRASLKDTAKTEKQTDFSLRFDELQYQISKLKEELNDARNEIKDLKDNSELKIEKLTTQVEQIQNMTQQGTTRNVTLQVNRPSGKADFERKLNSTQETLMTMISEVRRLVNKTDKDLREETRQLRWTGNSTNEKIHQVKDILVTLENKVRLQERQLNETIQLKVEHSDDVHFLKLLINNSRQDMVNKVNQMWSSVNTSGKNLQERLRSSRLELWAALNSTSMILKQKVSNISKTEGPVGPPGFNGSQGPAGPAGSPGPPGQKGAGDFSACTYNVKSGTTSGSSNVEQAFVDTPSGSIIIGVTCSTNYAGYNLKSKVISQKRRYICNCVGVSSHSSVTTKTCILHYWLCPIT